MSAETQLAGRNDSSLVFMGAALAGAFVAVMVGVFGRVHDPENTTLKLFFSDTIHVKVWVTTLVFALAIAQVFGGLWMFGKLPGGPAPSWVGPAHRISGTLAFLVRKRAQMRRHHRLQRIPVVGLDHQIGRAHV